MSSEFICKTPREFCVDHMLVWVLRPMLHKPATFSSSSAFAHWSKGNAEEIAPRSEDDLSCPGPSDTIYALCPTQPSPEALHNALMRI